MLLLFEALLAGMVAPVFASSAASLWVPASSHFGIMKDQKKLQILADYGVAGLVNYDGADSPLAAPKTGGLTFLESATPLAAPKRREEEIVKNLVSDEAGRDTIRRTLSILSWVWLVLGGAGVGFILYLAVSVRLTKQTKIKRKKMVFSFSDEEDLSSIEEVY